MQLDELMAHKNEILSIFKAYGVKNPRIFGSTASGNAGPESDVDFLVSWPARHSLFDRMRLQKSLSTLLKTRVDLVTDKSLYHGIRHQVILTARAL